ncbi:MAG: GNAT family protein [Anaerolineales bacterium]|jgi:ribosomal-protein-serine acetyltransferase
MSIARDIELRHDTGRIILRPPQMKDAESIYEAVHASLSELMPWMDWCSPDYSIDDTLERLETLPRIWDDGEAYDFAMVDADRGQLLGLCALSQIVQRHRFANLGYWVRSDRTGKGIATEAAQLLTRFGFRVVGLQRVEIVVGVENWASRRVAEKAGALFEGILRKRIKIGDRHIDAAMYSLVPDDLR